MKGNYHKGIKRVLQSAAGALTALGLTSSASAALSLGSADNYAVLGIGGTGSQFEIYQSGTVINGNVGVGPGDTFTHTMDATINGNLNYDPSVTLPSITGTITGGTHSMSMSSVVADALSWSGYYAGLPATQTYSTLSEGQTIVGTGGLNVIRVTGDTTLKTTFTIQGGPNDQFVFQMLGTGKDPLTLSGVIMSLVGVDPRNVLWSLAGTGDALSITSGDCLAYGIFLAPNRSILVDNADIVGSVIGGGGGLLSIHSTSSVTVPEPATIMAGALLLLPLGVTTLRVLRRNRLD